MSDFTQVLVRAQAGDSNASHELLPLVYEELRELAARKMAQSLASQTLQPTALVHEAWLKLVQGSQQEWTGRAHFFRAAAEAMRQILIDQIRHKASQKRGGSQVLEELHESQIERRAPSAEILAIHEALEGLATEDQLAAEVVKLRYFVGLTIPEIAEALEVTPRTADRHWAFARAWLKWAIELDRES
ncbi:MAG: ECF-type sigma factor [Limisphaerales bacterium]